MCGNYGLQVLYTFGEYYPSLRIYMPRKKITQAQFDKLYKEHKEQGGGRLGSRIFWIKNSILTGLILSNVDLGNARFTNCVFNNVSFTNTDISYGEFFACTFRNCSFRHVEAVATSFNKSTLSSCVFANCSLSSGSFVASTLRWGELCNCRLHSCSFTAAKLANCTFTSSHLIRCELLNATLSKLELHNTTITAGDLPYASCSWQGFGEYGRTIIATKQKGKVMFYCGCFSGNEKQLRAYIDNGDGYHRESRTKAMEFLLSCL